MQVFAAWSCSASERRSVEEFCGRMCKRRAEAAMLSAIGAWREHVLDMRSRRYAAGRRGLKAQSQIKHSVLMHCFQVRTRP